MTGPVLLDSDTLSELARGNPQVAMSARAYLAEHGRLSFTAVTVFERLRGYRVALREGKPYEAALSQFRLLVAASHIVPFDETAADHAATIWAGVSRKERHALGDLLIAAIASARGLPLVTRNRRDFERYARIPTIRLELEDWTRRDIR